MKDKNSATQEQPQNDAQEEEKKKRHLLWSDILDAVTDLIDAVVDWFNCSGARLHPTEQME